MFLGIVNYAKRRIIGGMSKPNPTRPEGRAEVSDEERRVIEERLKTFGEDRKQARPWAEVKTRILEHLKPS